MNDKKEKELLLDQCERKLVRAKTSDERTKLLKMIRLLEKELYPTTNPKMKNILDFLDKELGV